MAYELTQRERNTIDRINEKNEWGLSDRQTKSLIKKHQRGDERAKAKVEYQLHEINYHDVADALEGGNYEKANFMVTATGLSRKDRENQWEKHVQSMKKAEQRSKRAQAVNENFTRGTDQQGRMTLTSKLKTSSKSGAVH